MPNINKRPSHVAKIGRTPHHMTPTLKFTSSVGHLLPVFYDFLNPNESIRLSSELATKTVRPFKSPALLLCEEDIDYFYVPMTLLYTLFETTYYNISDIHQSVFDESQYTDDLVGANGMPFPTFSAKQIVDSFGSARNNLDNPNRTQDLAYVPNVQNAYRLMQLLGYSTKWLQFDDGDQYQENLADYKFDPWMAAAYQAIFYSYYRLSDWTTNDPMAYNMDQFYSSKSVSDTVVKKLFAIHYRPYKSDLFTNVYPSPLVSGNNVGILTDWLLDEASVRQFVGDDKSNMDTFVYQNKTIGSLDAVDTAGMRGMFAMEKLLEITRRAGKHVDDQTLAHFGIKPKERLAGEVVYLGSHSTMLQMGEIEATATSSNSTGTSVLGELAGNAKSYMKPQKPIEYTSTEHGIIMGIFSMRPAADYSADVALDKLNVLGNFRSLYYPEYDNLGMQPLYGYQAAFNPMTAQDSKKPNRLLSWQYRYSEFKQKYNRTAGALCDTLDFWTVTRNSEVVTDYREGWNMYVSPSLLNSVLEYQFPYSVNTVNVPPTDFSEIANAFVYDPFAHMIAFNYTKVSTMSTYSLSKL